MTVGVNGDECRHRMTRLRRSRNGGRAAGMASAAIIIDRAEGPGITAVVRSTLVLMLVLVVTKVLSGSAGLMLAVDSHRRPGGLERQEYEQENGEPAMHAADCSS